MLRLTLWNNAETEQHSVEIYEHMPVNLTYQFADTSEINKAVGGYSQTFRIPATKVNTDFFGAIYDANIFTDSSGLIKENYSVKRKIRAELSYNSLPLMKGFVQVKAVYLQKKTFADIELVFLSDAVDLATSIGDAMLSDLTTTSIDHELNIANVQASWLTFLSGNIRYGIMDKGRNWSFSDLDNPAWDITNGIYQSDLTPYVRIKWILDQIMSEAGYTYDSALFDTAEVLKMYMPAYNGAISPRSSNKEPSAQTCLATMDIDATGVVSTYATILLTTTGGFDYSNNFNNPAHRYTAPYNSLFTVKVTMTRSDDQTTYPDPIDIALYKNGSLYQEFSGQLGSSFTETIQLDLNTSDYLEMKWKTRGSTGGKILGNGTESETSMHITNVSEPVTGQDVDMSANMPEIKQIDFLIGLQKMFNLVFIPDKITPKHLIIEPFKDYTATGVSKDWTNKIDYTKDVVIQPTTDIQAKQYDWSHDSGGDFINTLIQNSTGRAYGRYRVTDSENDFATGTQVITTPFAPYLMSYIPSSLFSIHRCIDKDGKGVKTPKPRVVYWNGISTDFPAWYIIKDSLVASAAIGDFPHFSNYDEVIAGVTDNDLNFGYEFAFITADAHPLNTLYYRYWMAYVNELYSPQARMFTAYFKLTRAELQAFEYSDKIYLKDSYYRILKISNYDATTGGSVKVELLKVLSDIADCGDTPTGQNLDGAISFNGSAFDYGSKSCCERYGYLWLPRIGRCYPAPILIQPTND